MYSENHRFIEQDYWLHKAMDGNEHLSEQQLQAVLDSIDTTWKDLTFKFYPNGACKIVDNDTLQYIKPSELTGACLDFYIRKRIQWIKSDLMVKVLKYA